MDFFLRHLARDKGATTGATTQSEQEDEPARRGGSQQLRRAITDHGLSTEASPPDEELAVAPSFPSFSTTSGNHGKKHGRSVMCSRRPIRRASQLLPPSAATSNLGAWEQHLLMQDAADALPAGGHCGSTGAACRPGQERAGSPVQVEWGAGFRLASQQQQQPPSPLPHHHYQYQPQRPSPSPLPPHQRVGDSARSSLTPDLVLQPSPGLSPVGPLIAANGRRKTSGTMPTSTSTSSTPLPVLPSPTAPRGSLEPAHFPSAGAHGGGASNNSMVVVMDAGFARLERDSDVQCTRQPGNTCRDNPEPPVVRGPLGGTRSPLPGTTSSAAGGLVAAGLVRLGHSIVPTPLPTATATATVTGTATTTAATATGTMDLCSFVSSHHHHNHHHNHHNHLLSGNSFVAPSSGATLNLAESSVSLGAMAPCSASSSSSQLGARPYGLLATPSSSSAGATTMATIPKLPSLPCAAAGPAGSSGTLLPSGGVGTSSQGAVLAAARHRLLMALPDATTTIGSLNGVAPPQSPSPATSETHVRFGPSANGPTSASATLATVGGGGLGGGAGGGAMGCQLGQLASASRSGPLHLVTVSQPGGGGHRRRSSAVLSGGHSYSYGGKGLLGDGPGGKISVTGPPSPFIANRRGTLVSLVVLS